MFICLDDNKVVYSEKKMSKLIKIIPQFQEFRTKVADIYKEFNKHSAYMVEPLAMKIDSVRKSNISPINTKKPITKNLIYIPNKDEEFKCKKIFKLFRTFLEDISLNIVPKEPIFSEVELKVRIFFKIK